MNSKIRFWALLLGIQLCLVLLVWWRAIAPQAGQPTEPLLQFNVADISALEISTADESVRLQRDGETWVLPNNDRAPADASKVESLLHDLAALTATWPVADTAASAARFEVASDNAERSISLFQGDQTVARVYMGSSPGLRKVHIRVDGQDAIYPVALAHYQAPATADGWQPPPPTPPEVPAEKPASEPVALPASP